MRIRISEKYPVPRARSTNRCKYPWTTMKVGQSFYVGISRFPHLDLETMHHHWFSRISNANKRFKRTFTHRKEKSRGIRVWRVK